jgi:hypothetical protein
MDSEYEEEIDDNDIYKPVEIIKVDEEFGEYEMKNLFSIGKEMNTF